MDIILSNFQNRKLFLVLDLDQTILHAIVVDKSFNTAEFIEKENTKIELKIKKEVGEVDEAFDINQHLNSQNQTKYFIKGIGID